jgi:outer membrane protein assembly factor BamE (lipoprotein component of BamABCDE complex)
MKKFLSSIIALAIVGCATPYSDVPTRQSTLTPGMVSKQVVRGKTTQADIMEIFGPPDLVTMKNEYEMWGYDKVSREVAYTAFGLGLGGGGAVGAGGIGGLGGLSTGYSTQSTKTLFLLIYFDKNLVVSDYKLSATRF